MALKILMVTMGLGLGGAETHIVELARELNRRGHEVLVASNGGSYVEEIEREGIRHFKAPMHRRSLGCMARSYAILKKLIREERPDLVHAHARIPAFLCARLKKKLKFPFVTTAHWVFDTSHGLKYLTEWGQKTVAVSEDISDYLTDNYGIPKKDIFVTINGIDTEKFSADCPGQAIIDEFGLDAARPIVSHVSRLDESRALAARRLIEGAPALAAALPGVQILIAGGGDRYEELHAAADRVNETLGVRCVIMAGPRTDVNRIIAAGDVFVGVSRAALEAMACAKPVIVAGNEGYLGLFEAARLEEARESNFCCRGCPATEADRLAQDIADCFALGEAARQALGAYGRQVILNDYSVSRMAEDCMKAYLAALPKKHRVLLSGYFGFGNIGDEAILQAMITNIRRESEEIDITVLSKNPEDTAHKYDCTAEPRFNPFRVRRAVRQADALVSGGGSLLQDKTSTRSLLYYLSIIRMAERGGKKVMLYANGIGPVARPANRRRVAEAVRRADLVTLRDRDSADELRRMGVERDDLHVTVDPVFTLDFAEDARAEQILAEAGLAPGTAFAAVSVRQWPGRADFCAAVAGVCDHLAERYGLQTVFIAMQSPADVGVSEQVRRQMRAPAQIVGEGLQAEELLGVVGRARFVLSMRLHTLIFAARMGVPMAGIVYDPKTEYYLKMFGMPSAGRAECFERDEAVEAVDAVLKDREQYTQKLQERVAGFGALAHQNEKLLRALLERT